MKKKSKIKYVFLIIAVITGFTCISTIVVQAKSTKLVFEGEAIQVDFQIQDVWMEDGVYHIRYYRKSTLSGTIGGIKFIGHIEANGVIKIEVTGYYTATGKATSYTTWNEQKGTFYGPFNVKDFMVIIPSWGDFNGKSATQGTGDFNGWKQFGISWSIEEGRYGFSGTILIPN